MKKPASQFQLINNEKVAPESANLRRSKFEEPVTVQSHVKNSLANCFLCHKYPVKFYHNPFTHPFFQGVKRNIPNNIQDNFLYRSHHIL